MLRKVKEIPDPPLYLDPHRIPGPGLAAYTCIISGIYLLDVEHHINLKSLVKLHCLENQLFTCRKRQPTTDLITEQLLVDLSVNPHWVLNSPIIIMATALHFLCRAHQSPHAFVVWGYSKGTWEYIWLDNMYDCVALCAASASYCKTCHWHMSGQEACCVFGRTVTIGSYWLYGNACWTLD